jgi:serine/threonine protein kinase
VKTEGFAQDNKYIYIVLELINGGELFTYLRSEGKFTQDQSIFYAGQITLVFEYLHSMNIIYRDLKPENILIDVTGYLKLTDFGFAKVCETRTYTLCGTPNYLAPEVILNKGHGKSVDWWTLGILMYEMLVGIDPFNDEEPLNIYKNILGGKIKFPSSVDSNAKSIIRHLVDPDLSKRYGNLKNGVKDIKEHRFFKKLDWSSLLAMSIKPPYTPKINSASDISHFTAYGSSDSDSKNVVAIKPIDDPFLEW